jgi:hypothetical protein
MIGQTVKGAAQEMLDLANHLNVLVVCTINGVELHAARGMDVETIGQEYDAGIRRLEEQAAEKKST